MIVLSTDTPHHRFFINRLLQKGFSIDHIYFETNHNEHVPFYDVEQSEFEQNFFETVTYDLSKDLQISTIPSVNDLELEHASLGLVFGTGKIRPHIIDKFDILLNVHRGISHNYRGLDSDLWAIYNDDFTQIGVTIHLVEPTLDTGAIVKQGTVTLKSDMKIWHIRYYTTLLATDLVIDALQSSLNPKPQSKGKYFSTMPPKFKRIAKEKFDQYVGNLCSE